MKFLTLVLALSLSFLANAQTAKLQVIHNSPTPGTASGPTVDIYVGGALLAPLTAVPFRAATAFIDVASGASLLIEVRVSPSTTADPVVYTTNTATLVDNGVYQLIANGIVGDATTPFEIEGTNDAQLAASAGNVAFQVFHGSPSTPAVDVDARTIGTLVSNLSFGNYTADYITVPAAQYYLDVRVNGSNAILATYDANLSGLGGNALTVFASGFLEGAPSFGLFAATANGTVVELPATQIARVQVIHNSPSPTVDIYAGTESLLNDFAYQTATPYIFLPAGVEINLGVALANSTSSSDAIANFPVTLENGKTYSVIANGIVGNATTPFGLIIDAAAQEKSATDSTTAVSVFHGCTSASAIPVDVTAPFANALLYADVAYTAHTPYLELPSGIFDLAVVPANTNDWITLVEANLTALNGQAIKVLATGLLGSATDPFNLLAVLPNGETAVLTPEALLQVVHNSPLPAATSVDVYINGQETLPDFGFRTATGTLIVPARAELDFAVSVANTGINAAVLTANNVVLTEGKFYTIYAAGDGASATPFAFQISDATGIYATDPTKVQIRAVHGSVDAPEVDVNTGGSVLFGGLAYGEFSDYASVPAASYLLEVTPAGMPGTVVAKYTADLVGAEGGILDVFASGYLSPTGNEPAFGLWAALQNGTTFPLPAVVSTDEIEGVSELSFGPNPAEVSSTLRFNNTSATDYYVTVINAQGQIVQFNTLGKVAPGAFVYTVDTQNLPTGQYFVNLANASGFRSLPLQVVR